MRCLQVYSLPLNLINIEIEQNGEDAGMSLVWIVDWEFTCFWIQLFVLGGYTFI